MPHDLAVCVNMPCLRSICTCKSLRSHTARHDAGCSIRLCEPTNETPFPFWAVAHNPRTRVAIWQEIEACDSQPPGGYSDAI
jgi:hypothetical protein